MAKKALFIIFFLIFSFAGQAVQVLAQSLDTTPPVIFNIRPENIIGPGAQIKWSTDEPSDSKIIYGIVSGNFPYFADFRCDAGNMISDHCVNLTSLSPNTVYYYKVKSSDAAGNTAISSENHFTSGASVDSGAYVMTTPSSPSGLYASSPQSGYVTLSWTDNSSNESEFKIWRRVSGATVWDFIASLGINVTSFTETAVSPGSYEYHVNACNSYGCSADSNTAAVSVSGSTTTATTTTTTTTTTAGFAPTIDLKINNIDGTASLASPANYTLAWTTTGSPTSCDPSGTWADSGTKSVPFGYWSFNGVSVTGLKTYTLTCSNAYGSASDTVYADVVSAESAVAATTTTSMTSANALIKGVILDVADFPVAGANIYVFNKDFSVNFSRMADAGGSFSIEAPAGDYYFEISPPFGRNDLARPAPALLTVVGGETRNITAKFSGFTKTINGTVRFLNGRPVTDAEAGAYNSNTGQSIRTIVDASGNFSLKAGAGKWIVGIHPLSSSAAQWRWTPDLKKEIIFGDNTDSEIKQADFTVIPASSVIIVRTVDEASNLISGAGVVLDTAGAIQSSTGVYMPPETQKSDAAGQVKFTASAGRYYLRAFLPNGSGFIDPQEQPVDIGAGEEKTFTLVFRKPVLINSVSISGVARLDDGRPVDAIVWAWSQSGRSVETRANLKGEYSILVPYNDRWSIGAGKEMDGFPYKSTQILVDVKDYPVTADLILTKLSDKPLASSIAVQQAATQQIIARTADGAKVTVPAQAAGSSGNVSVEVTPTIEAPSQAASKVVGTVYDIVIKDQSGNRITQLKEKMEIILPYTEAQLKAQGVTEDSFVPSYFDETTGAWVKVDDYTVDKEKNLVVIRVSHLTRFAIVAAADIIPPAGPANTAAVSDITGEIVISWTNPASDFHHVKIYRSIQKAVIGQVVFNDVVVSERRDRGLTAGTTYYYTVRAVDPAGNESTNTNQVSAIASAVGAKISSFARNMKFGSRGNDVSLLQQTLIDQNVYPEKLVTGYFGSLTKAAVVRFQEKYSEEILKPLDLAKGTGFIGSATRAKLNTIISGK
ncbi:MAG: peptidoglycan-binding protein [Candidatus Brennerbacteria bacterium]|nr:peptidoglycan-binding protein [Candidatus Brennerbacteria bacterium]